MNKKRILLSALLIGMLETTSYGEADAAGQEVTAYIPSFAVQLNGAAVDNASGEYPLLVYKDVTYVPMTWEYSRTLGLETVWNEQTGLAIGQLRGMPHKLAAGAASGTAANDTSRPYTAAVVNYPVTVNGKPVDSSREPYPLLQFRDITYFPLTWKFARDEFHWETSWSSAEGLGIVSPQRQYFSEIVYADGDSLYVSSNFDGMYKVGKMLDGSVSRIGEEERMEVLKRSEQRYLNSRDIVYNAPIERNGDTVSYAGIELKSLAETIANDKAAYEQQPEYKDRSEGVLAYGSAVKLDDSRTVVDLSVYTQTHIPAPYTPHTNTLFLVDETRGVSERLEGYGERLGAVYRSPDGSSWIASGNAPKDIRVSNAGRKAQLLLLGADGKRLLVNELLQAADVDVLGADEDGALLVRAYNDRLYPNEAGQTDGFYRIDSSGGAEKLYDNVQGFAYADDRGDVYVVDKTVNRIMNISAGKSRIWWDYDFEEQ